MASTMLLVTTLLALLAGTWAACTPPLPITSKDPYQCTDSTNPKTRPDPNGCVKRNFLTCLKLKNNLCHLERVGLAYHCYPADNVDLRALGDKICTGYTTKASCTAPNAGAVMVSVLKGAPLCVWSGNKCLRDVRLFQGPPTD